MEQIDLWNWVRQNVHTQAQEVNVAREQCPCMAAARCKDIESKRRYEWALHGGERQFFDYSWVVKGK